MCSLCKTRAPTVSVVVEPPGGVASELGLTAVAVPICWAKLGATPAIATNAATATAKMPG